MEIILDIYKSDSLFENELWKKIDKVKDLNK